MVEVECKSYLDSTGRLSRTTPALDVVRWRRQKQATTMSTSAPTWPHKRWPNFTANRSAAYHGKSRIWEDEPLYDRFFGPTSAAHIVYATSLVRAINDEKTEASG
ncbi:MAG: hypothetical protein EDR02_01880 [Actinobacteria bacterium]|nr:MAG: hypothetical protein EDR02_01880 [Actinomycetota bacterium]